MSRSARKIVKSLLLIFIACLLVSCRGEEPTAPTTEPTSRTPGIGAKVAELKRLLIEKKDQGQDIAPILELNRKSRDAIRSGNQAEGEKLLLQALEMARQLPDNGQGKYAARSERQSGSGSGLGSFEDSLLSSPRSTSSEFQQENTEANSFSQQSRSVAKSASQKTKTSDSGGADFGESKTISLKIHGPEATAFLSVPGGYANGGQIDDYPSVYKGEPVTVEDGKVILTIDKRPMFLEVPINDDPEQSDAPPLTPFAIHGITGYDPELSKLGVTTVRLAGRQGMLWDLIEREKGVYDFSKTDRLLQDLHGHGIEILMTIKAFSRLDQHGAWEPRTKPNPSYPKDISSYQAFLSAAVERYDGDGIDDAPGSPVVHYWQIQNEVDAPHFWRDSETNYAKLVRDSYDPIKNANPEAKIVLSGFSSYHGFHSKGITILQALNSMQNSDDLPFFDIFDFHWSGQWGGNYRRLRNNDSEDDFMDVVKGIADTLEKYGYGGVPIWITEMSDHSGQPVGIKGQSYSTVSEGNHAADMVKAYIYGLAAGVERIFWVSLQEWNNYGNFGSNGYFDSVGLINNPKNDGLSNKKLAYYAYKLMSDKLSSLGSARVARLKTSSGIFVCVFKGRDKHTYVLWAND